ncbi:hypothetical protein [Actinokineospora sp. UTMC 2448]|uniref:hypothetical protein n=1 Tax=Actinokineospora sp. UTMC 2448 TaxID=2268449 RepID=UPI002164B058|nr:hypothetical protein [Actinokineospora sp. UTMC 2448]UVS81812.1 hypothetical protein Actkin_05576 [Actinokineospora sp. UTMC 2448]
MTGRAALVFLAAAAATVAVAHAAQVTTETHGYRAGHLVLVVGLLLVATGGSCWLALELSGTRAGDQVHQPGDPAAPTPPGPQNRRAPLGERALLVAWLLIASVVTPLLTSDAVRIALGGA